MENANTIERYIQDTRDKANAFIAEGKTTQTNLAKQAGISGAALSQFLTESYAGSNENIARKILPVLDASEARANSVTTVKEPDVVETAIMREIMFGLQYASDRNDTIVIYGAPGIGKTVAIEKYVKANPTVIAFTASPNIRNGRDVMEELLEAMNKNVVGRNKLLEKAIINALDGSNRMIIIDEAHFMRLSALETLRRICDATRCPLVLVGNPQIMEIITEKNKTITGQFFSRSVRFALDSEIQMQDVERIVQQNGVSLADSCLSELHKIANQIGALRVMTKLFLFAWTLATRKQENISLDHIMAAKKVIVTA